MMEYGLLDEDEARRVLVIKQNRGSRGFVAAKKELPSAPKSTKPASTGKSSVKSNPNSQNGVSKPKDVKGGDAKGSKPKRKKEEDTDDSEEAIPLKKLRR